METWFLKPAVHLPRLSAKAVFGTLGPWEPGAGGLGAQELLPDDLIKLRQSGNRENSREGEPWPGATFG